MKVVIVGGGQAGGWAARTLRDCGFTGEVVLVAEERHPPYQRPPLSKEVLLGEMAPEGCYLWPDGLDADLLLGTRAERIDRAAKQVVLADGTRFDFDRLVLATGGRARKLQREGVHYLRTIEDSVGLRAAMLAGGKVLIIGGGWIGLEAAATARKLGCEVTVVEATERLCVRVVPPIISTYLHQLHEREGVHVHCAASAEDFECATVLAGIGIVPNVELAQEAGLAISNGIVVNEFGQTSDPYIYAVGDVANLNGVRVESWANAQNQAIAAAKTIAGNPTSYQDIPWFWSNQFHVNLQFLGLPALTDRIVLRGDPSEDHFSVFFINQLNRLSGVVSANAMADIRVGKRLMERQIEVDELSFADVSKPLKDLLKS